MPNVPTTKDSYGGPMMGDSKKSLCARIDLRPNMNLPDGATLGSDVEIIIKGKVTALRGATMDSYKDSKGKTIESIYPGELKVEVSSVAIGAVGEYDGMEDD